MDAPETSYRVDRKLLLGDLPLLVVLARLVGSFLRGRAKEVLLLAALSATVLVPTAAAYLADRRIEG